jgi:hypothetical protein
MRRLLILPTLALFVLATAGFREPLTWPAPSMGAGARAIQVPPSGGDWWGVPLTQDCDVRLPAEPVRRTVKISGCRDVRIVGGEIASDAAPCSEAAKDSASTAGLYVTGFAGVAHVEGLKIHGRGFSDGIWMTSDEPGSVGQVEGNWIAGLAACSEPVPWDQAWPDEHPDCFQTWTGPATLRFDKNTCWTPYQGLYLDTNQLAGPSGSRLPAKTVDIRRTNVHLDERSPNGRGCYMVWTPGSPAATHLDRVHCAPGTRDWRVAFAPRLDVDPAWAGVLRGVPARGDEVTAGEAGIGYRRLVPAGTRTEDPRAPGSATPSWLEDPAKGLVQAPRRRFALLSTLRRGLRVKVRCRAGCRIAVRALAAPRARRWLRLGHSHRPVQVGAGRGKLAKAGTRVVALRFGGRARRGLRRARRVELALRVVIASGAARGVVSRSVVLRRRG